MHPSRASGLVALASLALAACDLPVNRDLTVAAGARTDGATLLNGHVSIGPRAVVGGDLRTVNGRIEVEGGAEVGDLSTINGSIRLADGARARSVRGVNSRIEIGERVEIAGDVTTVNGGINVGASSVLHRDVTTASGDLRLRGVRVAGSVRNAHGDLRLLDGTQVEGDVVLGAAEPGQAAWVSTVVVGVGVRVRGELRAERPIRLYVHPTAKLGEVAGAQAQAFQGTDVVPGDA